MSIHLAILIRALMLGAIVFGSITAIPNREVSLHSRVLISTIVVLLYALLDYFVGFFGVIHSSFCRAACDCTRLDKYSAQHSVDIDSLSTEVEQAIKLLDMKGMDMDMDMDTEDEKAAVKKATGENNSSPIPAETKEGFMNYSSWE